MHYLAYGSNLHPLRLMLRVPNVRLVGTTKLEGCRLTFHKRSTDSSSKCNLDFTDDPANVSYGAIYDVPEDDVHHLDEAEGLGNGYYKQQLTVSVGSEALNVFVYLASSTHLVADLEPYHWYKGFVVAGARKHSFPAEYIAQIASFPSKYDTKGSRRNEMENLLVQLEG